MEYKLLEPVDILSPNVGGFLCFQCD